MQMTAASSRFPVIVQEDLLVSSIRMDDDVFPRACVNEGAVQEYAEHFQEGGSFPPIEVVRGPDGAFVIDGWHRLLAAKNAKRRKIAARIWSGTKRDAIQMALGKNSENGVRRTNGDKRHVVERVLRDPDWAKWSDGVIAARCAVSQPFVSRVRRERDATQTGSESAATPRIAMRNGKEVLYETANIGRRQGHPAPGAEPAPPDQIPMNPEQRERQHREQWERQRALDQLQLRFDATDRLVQTINYLDFQRTAEDRAARILERFDVDLASDWLEDDNGETLDPAPESVAYFLPIFRRAAETLSVIVKKLEGLADDEVAG